MKPVWEILQRAMCQCRANMHEGKLVIGGRIFRTNQLRLRAVPLGGHSLNHLASRSAKSTRLVVGNETLRWEMHLVVLSTDCGVNGRGIATLGVATHD